MCVCVRALLADLQQFFTGKLYVPVSQLKLPAEELLWSALSYDTREGEETSKRKDYWIYSLTPTSECLLSDSHVGVSTLSDSH
ncbi:hypothetical protein COCON_G00072570, partial [Conger conger]